MEDKVILISGGSGSFGRSITREFLKFCPKAIRIFDHDEFSMVEMQHEFKQSCMRFMVGDIRERGRLRRALNDVDIVVHAGALKHVSVCEYNPIEAVRTNIDGSINVVDAALDCGVERVLFISSDKAVHPINLYGATKLVGEKLFVQANVYGKTKFSCVRYGNFWGSRGSVLPLWARQRKSGVITVTEKEMTRFWITLEEASSFAVSCIDRMEGGEIFIPVMPTHTLEELASNLAPEAKINIIGKRRGEKKTEELIAEGEEAYLTREDDCMVLRFDA